jgi:trigger factor
MLGLRAGEDLKVNGSQETGVVATYEMHLKQVKERELPELTDEWVQENTEWTSVAEMRDNVVTQLRRRRIVEAQLSQRDNTLVALSQLVPEAEVPETLIVAETNERLHDLGHRLGQQNLNLETFLSVTNQSSDDLLATLRRDAVRAVRVDLAMRALVREESLEPSDEEIEEELVKTAEAMGSTPEVLRRNLRDTGRVVAFNAEVAKIKASRWLNEHVTYVDPTGVEIDPELLRADQSDSLDA